MTPLPQVTTSMPDMELAVALYGAAWTLEMQGRRFLSGCIFGAGSRLRMTADALGRAAEVLFGAEAESPARDHPAFVEARSSLAELVRFRCCDNERLETYSAALASRQSAPHDKCNAAKPRPGASTVDADSRMADGRRRFLVMQVVSGMAWSGAVWAVGCTTLDRAVSSFQRRVARNLLMDGDDGAVMAYDRKLKRLVAWTAEISDPVAAAQFWCS